MSQRQPPNSQSLRPQHLTQVGHEGNPVEFFLVVTGTLDSPNPFCQEDCGSGSGDLGGPVPYPVPGTGGSGGEAPTLPMNVSGEDIQCIGDGEGATATVTVTGGVPPYTWGTSAGIITPSASTTSAVLSMAANAGSGESPGTAAYGKVSKHCCVFTSCNCKKYNCAGALIQDCTGTGCQTLADLTGKGLCSCSSCSNCPGLDCCLTDASCGGGAQCLNCCDITRAADGCACLSAHGAMANLVSASGLSADCQPCAIQFEDGAVVTVTDSEETSLSVHIEQDVTG